VRPPDVTGWYRVAWTTSPGRLRRVSTVSSSRTRKAVPLGIDTPAAPELFVSAAGTIGALSSGGGASAGDGATGCEGSGRAAALCDDAGHSPAAAGPPPAGYSGNSPPGESSVSG